MTHPGRPPSPFSPRASAILAAMLALLPAPDAAALHPTPEIRTIEPIGVPGAIAYAMRAPLPGTRSMTGLSLLCRPSGSERIAVTAYFGGFPPDRRPVQLAVGTRDGTVLRFGPVVRGGREHGFHSPVISDPRQAERFLRAALSPGSLVSNGYNSFRNRVAAARNRTVLHRFLSCMDNTPP